MQGLSGYKIGWRVDYGHYITTANPIRGSLVVVGAGARRADVD
jgi:hypothetical protein